MTPITFFSSIFLKALLQSIRFNIDGGKRKSRHAIISFNFIDLYFYILKFIKYKFIIINDVIRIEMVKFFIFCLTYEVIKKKKKYHSKHFLTAPKKQHHSTKLSKGNLS